jgi:hypothetical protein
MPPGRTAFVGSARRRARFGVRAKRCESLCRRANAHCKIERTAADHPGIAVVELDVAPRGRIRRVGTIQSSTRTESTERAVSCDTSMTFCRRMGLDVAENRCINALGEQRITRGRRAMRSSLSG